MQNSSARVLKRFFWVCLWALSASGTAWAGLEFETRTITSHAGFLDKEFKAEFPYTNTGPHPVTITDTLSSCGCTVVSLTEHTVAKGASGTLSALFTFGARKGRQVKEILVITDDPEQKEERLTLIVHLPEYVRIKPSFVYWSHGAPLEPNILRVEVLSDEPLSIRSARSSSEKIAVAVETVDPGKSYRIVLTPETTREYLHASIAIEVMNPAGQVREYKAYARILPAGTNSR